jgi:Undecaprenyl-phosphate glucose phosphotransferase
MTIVPTERIVPAPGPRWFTASRGMVATAAMAADALIIVGVAGLMGALYHGLVYGDLAPIPQFVNLGCVAAIIFILQGSVHNDYAFSNFLAVGPQMQRVFTLWNLTFICLLALGFLAKMTEIYSRATILLIYAGGLPMILLGRHALVRLVALGSRIGLVAAQRVLLIGDQGEIDAFLRRHQPRTLGLALVGALPLPAPTPGASEAARRAAIAAEVAPAVAAARDLRADAVLIVAPWSDIATIDLCVEEFGAIPADIHLGPERILDRFAQVRIARLGSMPSLQLTRAPLTDFELLKKRIVDLLIAATALVLLAPLIACVALIIRLDSPGPVFFLQRRYGFNQKPFRIIKFRTMTTLEDGERVVQATAGDSRITRVGRWLRRWNIDELPQLVNVLIGDMSLVGPRPHALSHDRCYEQRIARYARRHNVRPGITGWAQVNGLRGETQSVDQMRRRVEHDLYYIDNWSMFFDLRILLLTVVSPMAYRNAV